MKVLILAAGYGTRLYPVITDTPKPLLEIAGMPLIDYLLAKVRDIENLTELLVVTNNKFEGNFRAWAEAKRGYACPISIINDGTDTPDDRLGSIGDIQFVLKHHRIEEDLLVIGGDNLFDYGIEKSVHFAQARKPHVTIGLFDIHDRTGAKQFGVVDVDAEGKLLSFEEKPENPKTSLIAMCFYFFPRESLGQIERYIEETKKADKAGEYIKWLVEHETVFGFTFTGKWYDIGSIESYHAADRDFRMS